MVTGATHIPEEMHGYRCFVRLQFESLLSLLRSRLASIKAVCPQRVQNEPSEGGENKHGLPSFM